MRLLAAEALFTVPSVRAVGDTVQGDVPEDAVCIPHDGHPCRAKRNTQVATNNPDTLFAIS